ncbi:MAG: hypothetical protein ACUVSX_16810 [Aggregatilineales bacterium]
MDAQTLAQEREIVRKIEALLAELGPFLSLSEASAQTGIPLSTLAEAVRAQRVPALRVQKRRWLVRLEAVRAWFGDAGDDEYAAQRRLLEAGLITEIRRREDRRLAPFDPAPYKSRKPASESLVEDRR